MKDEFTVYTRKSPPCPSCIQVKAIMQSKGMAYKEVILGQNIEAGELSPANFAILFPGQRTVPFIVWNEGVFTKEAGERVIGGLEAFKEEYLSKF